MDLLSSDLVYFRTIEQNSILILDSTLLLLW